MGRPRAPAFEAWSDTLSAGVSARSWIVVAASLAVGLCTLFSMTKIWSGVFWGEPEQDPPREPRTDRKLGGPLLMIAPTAALALGSIAVTVFAGPLYDVAERAAHDLLDEQVYIDAVLSNDDLEEAQP